MQQNPNENSGNQPENYMKYVIFQLEKDQNDPYKLAIFSDSCIHSDMVPPGHCAIAAGSCVFRDKFYCTGFSKSLGVSSNGTVDNDFIAEYFKMGAACGAILTERYKRRLAAMEIYDGNSAIVVSKGNE